MKRPTLTRAKDANDEKPRYFQKGVAGPGRPRGVSNKTTTQLKTAILLAAEKHGLDGEGADGLTGYLRMLARDYPKSYCSLLGRVLPYQVNATVDDKRELRTPEEVTEELQRRGLPLPKNLFN